MDHGLKGHLHNYCTQFPMSCTLWHILLMKRRQRSDHIFHLWFLSFSEIAGALIMWERRRGVLIMWKWAIASDEKSILDHKLQLCEQQEERRSGKYSLWGGRECAQHRLWTIISAVRIWAWLSLTDDFFKCLRANIAPQKICSYKNTKNQQNWLLEDAAARGYRLITNS